MLRSGVSGPFWGVVRWRVEWQGRIAGSGGPGRLVRARTSGAWRAAGRRARRAAASVGSGWREGLIAAVAYGLYSLVKGLWGGSLEEGRRAAASLIDLEKSLGIYVEPDLQRFFVDHHLGMPFWNAFYVVSQVVVLPLTLFLVYRYARGSYAFVRNMAVLSWTRRRHLVRPPAGRPAPPAGLGLHGHRQHQTFFQLDSEFIRAFYNPVAAMPSLHVGMAPVVAWALIRLTPWVWTKALGVAYPLPRRRRRSSSRATTSSSTSPAGSRSCCRPRPSRPGWCASHGRARAGSRPRCGAVHPGGRSRRRARAGPGAPELTSDGAEPTRVASARREPGWAADGAGQPGGPAGPQPADVLGIFGITGDLATRMTLPSLYRLERRGLLDVPGGRGRVRRLDRRPAARPRPRGDRRRGRDG